MYQNKLMDGVQGAMPGYIGHYTVLNAEGPMCVCAIAGVWMPMQENWH